MNNLGILDFPDMIQKSFVNIRSIDIEQAENKIFDNFEKGFIGEDDFNSCLDVLEKARSGKYKDTPQNRRMHRVGQQYGKVSEEEKEGKGKSKNDESENIPIGSTNLKGVDERIDKTLNESFKQQEILSTVEVKIDKIRSVGGIVPKDLKDKQNHIKARLRSLENEYNFLQKEKKEIKKNVENKYNTLTPYERLKLSPVLKSDAKHEKGIENLSFDKLPISVQVDVISRIGYI